MDIYQTCHRRYVNNQRVWIYKKVNFWINPSPRVSLTVSPFMDDNILAASQIYALYIYVSEIKHWGSHVLYINTSCIQDQVLRIIDINNINMCIIHTCIRINDHNYMHHIYASLWYMYHRYMYHRYMHHTYIHPGYTLWIHASCIQAYIFINHRFMDHRFMHHRPRDGNEGVSQL